MRRCKQRSPPPRLASPDAPFAAARAYHLARRALTPAAGRGGAGESELLAAWLADSVLAQKLNWPFALPLLAAPPVSAAGRRAAGNAADGDAPTRVLFGYAKGAANACDLAAELRRQVDRLGFAVELGPGRNDGGVDVRVYPMDGEPARPPLILVQCKRQKKEVDALVVKALHADVLHEQAQSGLIVTTSRLSPGAESVRQARAYRIDASNRETLRAWLMDMRRSPLL